jgi:hypothetical protein
MIKKLLAGLSLAGLVMGSIVAPVQAEERPIGAITCDDVALAKQFSQLSDTTRGDMESVFRGAAVKVTDANSTVFTVDYGLGEPYDFSYDKPSGPWVRVMYWAESGRIMSLMSAGCPS